MLDDKRIKEAEQNVREYLQAGMLKKQAHDKEIEEVLLTNSQESRHTYWMNASKR